MASSNVDTTVHYAHSIPTSEKDSWESLEDHSFNVAKRAGANARSFQSECLGQIAGLLHDLGKAKTPFQAKLEGAQIKVSHSGEGALAAIEHVGPGIGKLLAYAIAGHHAGLANGVGKTAGTKPATPLDARLMESENLALPNWLQLPEMELPHHLVSPGSSPWFVCQLWTRMLFSALVDADYIATEKFYSPELREETVFDLVPLREALDKRLAAFPDPVSTVNKVRKSVLEAAIDRASDAPGFFSMTVPTGGGKTLSSFKFALDHAVHHDMRRVIHVAPFSAIIDQTASIARDVLGHPDAVLEHHTAFQAEGIMDDSRAEALRLAAQNWDRPFVVTTAVQFFESLFANRTQKCRKLHNIAQSVIVLDEAQSLPLPFLRPCLAVLRELVRGYGCSVVLCTATQPAVHDCDGLDCAEALEDAATREIAPEPEALYARLKRVSVAQVGRLSNEELVEQVRGRSALVIVNNKKQARVLYDLMSGDGVFHLSTNMTARHRRAELASIRERLAANLPCLVVSTALVEAGVDLDFPEVWRAVAGVDSIAQAAGRCNREGTMPEGGRVYVFEPDEAFPPPPELQRNADVARAILAEYADPLVPDAITAYFRSLYRDWGPALDAKAILARLEQGGGQFDFPFADIARDFKLIEEFTVPLIIGDGEYGLDEKTRKLLEHGEYAGSLARALQPFTIQVSPRVRDRLVQLGAAEIKRADVFDDQFVVLSNSRLYDSKAGFTDADPEDLGVLIVG